jgi:excisionase family DNA binding protein
MATIITTVEVAERLKVSVSLVQKFAKRHNIGQLLPGGRGMRIFSEADIKKLENRKTQPGPAPAKKVKKS